MGSTQHASSSTAYHLSVQVDGEFDEVVERARTALGDHGFGILTEIDVAATLRRTLGVEMGQYLILGACHPPSAHQVLREDPSIGVLLPCNVVVRRNGSGILVDFMDPAAVMGVVDRPDIVHVADAVRARLEQVRDALATG